MNRRLTFERIVEIVSNLKTLTGLDVNDWRVKIGYQYAA